MKLSMDHNSILHHPIPNVVLYKYKCQKVQSFSVFGIVVDFDRGGPDYVR